jgi:hypothetical protein
LASFESYPCCILLGYTNMSYKSYSVLLFGWREYYISLNSLMYVQIDEPDD